MERSYQLEIGDVTLIATGGWGFCDEDEGKYVEVVGHNMYTDGSPALLVVPYNCKLDTKNSLSGHYMCGYESFGSNPLILLNTKEEIKEDSTEQYTGSSSNYYKVYVKHPTTLPEPYEAECNDLIEALQMTFAEGNAFKAIWRKAKARQGVKKKGYDNGVYDSEKVVFFGERMLIEARDEG